MNSISEEEWRRNLGWCHVHAQYIWHSEARIEGTRTALIAIRNAIDRALTTGMDAEAMDLIAADGEGYRLKVSIRNLGYLERQTLPYTAHYANGVGAEEVEAAKDEELRLQDQIDELYEIQNG